MPAGRMAACRDFVQGRSLSMHKESTTVIIGLQEQDKQLKLFLLFAIRPLPALLDLPHHLPGLLHLRHPQERVHVHHR